MGERIRILALDHFSGQDREALVAAGADGFAWRTIPYWRFRDPANEIFPPEVREGLESWARPELAEHRRTFAAWCRRMLTRLYLEWPFDVLLLPSDSFYYVRALPDVCHELGIPVFVAQKETTITDHSMAEHAPQVHAFAPFISDRMTVCSERHKQFWVEAGTEPTSIEVTGQPRFDVYAQPRSQPARGRRTVLFLSYEPDAYLLETADRKIGWLDLRDETERVLYSSKDHAFDVVVKLHPLQNRAAEAAAFEMKAGGNPRIRLAPEDADTRELILEADAVVGFQTTALYEAMAAGKPIAYTAWGASYERFAPLLIPFDQRDDLIQVVRSGEELASWLREPPSVDATQHVRRLTFVEEMLGLFDGKAATRTLQAIRSETEKWSSRAATSSRRRMLGRARLFARPMLMAAAAVQSAALRVGATLPGRVGNSAASRAPHHTERLAALRRAG